MAETRGTPDQPMWARAQGGVNLGVRRGAWYRVIELTPDEVVLEVNRTQRRVPRAVVELDNATPRRWTVVPRPRDAVRVPDDWGDRYAICPACRSRTALKGHPHDFKCPRCSGAFQVNWDEVRAQSPSKESSQV